MGCLQVTGIDKAKKNKKWKETKTEAYKIIEKAVASFTSHDDTYIYSDSRTLLVGFAENFIEEARVKITLIAAEINTQLRKLKDTPAESLQIDESMASIRINKGDNNFEKVIKKIQANQQRITKSPPTNQNMPPPTKNAEISKSTKSEKKPIKNEKYHFSFIPMWDVRKNYLSTYLYLAHKTGAKCETLDDHELVYQELNQREKEEFDVLMLQNSIYNLETLINENKKHFLVCPVHFETLNNPESFQNYASKCENIDPEHKCFLIFMILDFPLNITEIDASLFTSRLQKFCCCIYAQLNIEEKRDIEKLNDFGFDAVGIRVKKHKDGEKVLIDILETFSGKAKVAKIPKTFLLDVSSLSLTTSAVCANYELISGSAIHESVQQPDNALTFKHQNLFSDIIHDRATDKKVNA